MIKQLLIWTVAIILTTMPVFGQTKEDKEQSKNRVTINHFGTTNESRFLLFKDNLNKKIKDNFEIWRYTREGDPIITKVKFNGKTVIIKTSNRRDKYASTIDRLMRDKHKVSVDSVKKVNTTAELFNL